jgi:hypothetical protein
MHRTAASRKYSKLRATRDEFHPAEQRGRLLTLINNRQTMICDRNERSTWPLAAVEHQTDLITARHGSMFVPPALTVVKNRRGNAGLWTGYCNAAAVSSGFQHGSKASACR